MGVDGEPLTYETTRRVEFRDTDTAGMVHFSAFFVYMEQAEHEMLRHLGLSVVTEQGDVKISWPRVAASCDYRTPARFDDVLDVEVLVDRVGGKSITYAFRFTREKLVIAAGKLTVVCCRFQHGEPPRSIAIPDWFVQGLSGLAQK